MCECCEANPYKNYCIQQWFLIVWHQVVGKNWAKIGTVVRNRWLARLWCLWWQPWAGCRAGSTAVCQERCSLEPGLAEPRSVGSHTELLAVIAACRNLSSGTTKTALRVSPSVLRLRVHCHLSFIVESWNALGGRELRAVPPSATLCLPLIQAPPARLWTLPGIMQPQCGST